MNDLCAETDSSFLNGLLKALVSQSSILSLHIQECPRELGPEIKYELYSCQTKCLSHLAKTLVSHSDAFPY